MPIKWKIYYMCSICYLLWNTCLLLVGANMMISDTDQSYGGYAILLIPFAMLAKPLLSLKFISHFKKKSYYTKNEFIAFSLYFIVNIIFTFYVVVSFCLYTFQAGRANITSIEVVAITASALFILASGYLIRFDMPLQRLIRKQRFDNIDTIGKK